MQLQRVPIVETRAAHRVLVDAKTELADQVQDATAGHTQPRDVPGIGRDLRLDQHDVERSRDLAGTEPRRCAAEEQGPALPRRLVLTETKFHACPPSNDE